MKLRRLAITTAAATVALAAPAAAADHQFAMSPATPNASWEGAEQTTHGLPLYVEEARTAVPCGTPGARPCEEVLFKVDVAGKLLIKVSGAPDLEGETDPDLYVYKSDDAGTMGEPQGSSAVSGPDTVTVKVTPGFYLAQVDYYHAEQGGYFGEAKLSGFAAPVEPVTIAPVATAPAPATPAAAPAPAAKKKSSCKAKAKKIKNAKKRKKALKKCARAKR